MMSEQPNLTPLPNLSDAEVHLQRLLAQEVDEPWFQSFWRNLNETLRPPQLPPLQVTSKPVAVKSIWGFSGGHEKNAGVSSLVVHCAVVGILFLVGTNRAVQQAAKEAVHLIAPDIAAYMPQKPKEIGGGGGGGDRSPVPASKGKLPKIAPRQFTPPSVIPLNPNPKLVMEPTLVMQPDAPIPQINLAQFGDPFGKTGPPSNGTGFGGGIGSGGGGGVGSGTGAGFGPGSGGNMGGGAFRVGGGVSAPLLVFKVEPEYSEEARKAKFQGTVILSVIVDEKGNPRELRVVRALGLGLDEKAIEAVQKWRFKPGFKDGRAVAVNAMIEVNFRLL